MTNDIRHIAAQELIIKLVLPEIAGALEVAVEGLQSDLDLPENEAKQLIYGYFASFAGKYPAHIHKPDYGAIFWQFELAEHRAPGLSNDDSDTGTLPSAA